MARIRRHKYHAKSSKCYQGHYHPSKLEAGYCDMLALLKKNGDIYDFVTQPRFRLEVNGQKICEMVPDFKVWRTKADYEADHYEIHETKGYEHPTWNIKRKLFEALFPHIDYIIIK